MEQTHKARLIKSGSKHVIWRIKLVAGARFERGLSDKNSDKNLPLTPAQAALVAGARRKRSLLHAAWDITAVKRPKTEIDYDALLGFPSPSLP